MRKILIVLIFFTVFSCSKDKLDNNVSLLPSNTESLLTVKINVDSCVRMNAGAFMESNLTEQEKDSIAKISIGSNESINAIEADGPEYTDWSGKIHLKIFYETSVKTNHPRVVATVSEDYVVVGGGAWAYGWVDRGAFLTESRPNADLTKWIASSKDHTYPDPHYLKAYAIGMKIDGITIEEF